MDLSTCGHERIKLNHNIELVDSEMEVDPQNPNPCGARDGDDVQEMLVEIIRNFNERWYQGWSSTQEEQRIKFINIADSIKKHADFEEKYNNKEIHNRELAYEKIFEEMLLKNMRNDLYLYKLLSSDVAFKATMPHNLRQITTCSLRLIS